MDTLAERRFRLESSGAIAAAATGMVALVLAVLGLLTFEPIVMVSVATALVGAGLVLEGFAKAARLYDLNNRLDRAEAMATGGGLSIEVLGGAATLILGILAGVGAAPIALTSVAAIVAGGSMLLGSGANARIGDHRPTEIVHASTREREAAELDQRTRRAVRTGGTAELVVGLGAIVLGVLALTGLAPLTLALLAMLALGAAILLSGGSIGARIAAMLRGA